MVTDGGKTAALGTMLVSGAGGFVGKRLCAYLRERGYTVRTLDRIAPVSAEGGFQMDLAKDACPPGLCEDVDTLFHLAGKAHAVAETGRDAEQYWQINTEGTRKLLAAAQQAGVRCFVYVSSVKAVGEAEEQPMDETVALPADTPYGESKYAAEQLVLHGGYVPHPVVLRPTMVYGETDKGNLPRMVRAVRRGLFPPLPEFDNKRSMVHVDDLAQAALLASQNAVAAGQVYIVAGERAYSTRQIYDGIRTALGLKPAGWTIPLCWLQFMAGLGDRLGKLLGRRFVFDNSALAKLAGSACYSSAKIRRELGYRPQHDLQTSLPAIVRFLASK